MRDPAHRGDIECPIFREIAQEEGETAVLRAFSASGCYAGN